MKRRDFPYSARLAAIVALLASLVIVGAAHAHHGWAWATDEQFELTGTITKVDLGNPHGEVTLNVDGKTWVVEVGQPWRNERAGLSPEVLAPGAEMTAYGHRSPSQRLVKAERVVVAGENYVLYPDRLP